MLRSALDVAPSPPSFCPFLIIILVAVVAIVAMLILMRVLRASRAMTELMVAVAGLMPLDVLPHPPSPSPTGVYPQQGQGFAAYFVGGFMALGLLLLIMVLLRLRPKRRDRRTPDH
jgi:hypothetical protein